MSDFCARQLWQERDRDPPRVVCLLKPVQHWGEPAWTALLITHYGDLLKRRGRVTSILRESTLLLKWKLTKQAPS